MNNTSFFSTLIKRYKKPLTTKELGDLLPVKIDQVISQKELTQVLQNKKKVVVKFGIDPTGPDIHLGHLLPIMILRQFQRAGHHIHFVIGDFTARIGDPSGKTSQRSVLSEKEIEKNKKTYLSQIKPFIDIKKTTIHHNRKWLKKYSFEKILSDLQHVSVSEVLQREDFRKRIEAGNPLSLAELLYAYAQGIDSLHINPDIEVGGRDQLLNFAQARSLMKQHNLTPEVAITTPVLEGIYGDGSKMSKSLENYISLSASTKDIFGKILSIPDTLIYPYLASFADIYASEKKEVQKMIKKNPLEMKKVLALFVVYILSGSEKKAHQEREHFEKTFSKKDFSDIETYQVQKGVVVLDFIASQKSLGLSKSQIKRLALEGSIRIVEPKEQTLEPYDQLPEGIVKVGKKHFFNIEYR